MNALALLRCLRPNRAARVVERHARRLERAGLPPQAIERLVARARLACGRDARAFEARLARDVESLLR